MNRRAWAAIPVAAGALLLSAGTRTANGEADWPRLPTDAEIRAAAAEFVAAMRENPETSQSFLWTYWRKVYEQNGFSSWWTMHRLAQAPDVVETLATFKWHRKNAADRFQDPRAGMLYEIQLVTPEYTRFVETPMGPLGVQGSQELKRQTRYGMAYLYHDPAHGWWFNLGDSDPGLWNQREDHAGDLAKMKDAGFVFGFANERAYTLEVLKPYNDLTFRIRLSQDDNLGKPDVAGKLVTLHLFDRHMNHVKLKAAYVVNREARVRPVSATIQRPVMGTYTHAGNPDLIKAEKYPPERIQLDENGEALVEVFLDFARLAALSGKAEGVHLPTPAEPLRLTIGADYADMGPDGKETVLAHTEKAFSIPHVAVVDELRVKQRSYPGHPGEVCALGRYDDALGVRRVLLYAGGGTDGRVLRMGETVNIDDRIVVDARDMYLDGKPASRPELGDWHGYIALRLRFLDGVVGELQVNEMYGKTSMLIGASPAQTGFQPQGMQFVEWAVGEGAEEAGKTACKMALGTVGALAVGAYNLYDDPHDAFTVVCVAAGVAPKYIRVRSALALGFNSDGQMALMTRQGRPVLYTVAAPDGIEVGEGKTAGVRADGTVEVTETTPEMARRADEAIEMLRRPVVADPDAVSDAGPPSGGEQSSGSNRGPARWIGLAAVLGGLFVASLVAALLLARRKGGSRS
jgi:hypothetical protein